MPNNIYQPYGPHATSDFLLCREDTFFRPHTSNFFLSRPTGSCNIMEQSSEPSTQITEPHTYHCICTNLVLAYPTKLSKLSRRAGDALDRAYIVPVSSDDDHELLDPSTGNLLGLDADSKPVMIRREDGFEKRYPLRCTRCQLTVGYHLDSAQIPDQVQSRFGPWTSTAYLLPGGLLNTKDMVAGKDAALSMGLEKLSVNVNGGK